MVIRFKFVNFVKQESGKLVEYLEHGQYGSIFDKEKKDALLQDGLI